MRHRKTEGEKGPELIDVPRESRLQTHVTETPVKRPSLYISGTISSDPSLTFEQARARFDAAKASLTALGYHAVSPTDMEGECGLTSDECLAGQRHLMPSQGQGNHSWECYLRGDIRAMLLCDGVALLPNWERSTGARLEFNTAVACGLDVRPIDQWPLVEDDLTKAVNHVAGMDLNEVAMPHSVWDENSIRVGWGRDTLCAVCRRPTDRHAPPGAPFCDYFGPGTKATCGECGSVLTWDGWHWLDAHGYGACAASKDPDPVHVAVEIAQ